MIIKVFTVREYLTRAGNNPFREWLATLPVLTVARVQARVLRIERGLLGDFKAIGHGVSELRLDFGPGYRIYFGMDRREIVILLAGGDKASQRRDLIRARQYWLDYKGRKKDGTPKC